MKIAEAIGQKKPFRNSKHQAIINLMFTHNWMLSKLRDFFKPFGITEKQYNILRILKGADKPLTTSVIRHRLLDKMSDTTRVIDRMIKKGIVTKKVNDVDRRLVDISLSAKGITLLAEIDKNVSRMDNILGSITKEEAESLNVILDKLRTDRP